MASGGYNWGIKLWDAATGLEVQELNGHRNKVSSVAFCPDGMLLASGSPDGTIKLWDTVIGTELKTLRHAGSGKSVAFSPDGGRLAVCGDKAIKIWDAPLTVETTRLRGHSAVVNSVALSRDGSRVGAHDPRPERECACRRPRQQGLAFLG